ncbi:MAG: hypothetical protein ACOYXU_08475 [Nitrospirota bacterium]
MIGGRDCPDGLLKSHPFGVNQRLVQDQQRFAELDGSLAKVVVLVFCGLRDLVTHSVGLLVERRRARLESTAV